MKSNVNVEGTRCRILLAPLELNRHELLDLNGIYENIIVYARIP